MAKNIYTLQQYKLIIDNKEVWLFEVRAYSTDWNALHYFGNGICKGLKPCIEELQVSKKEAINRKKDMEEYMLKTGREIYNQNKHGLLSIDYTWAYDEETKTNVGTLKEREQ